MNRRDRGLLVGMVLGDAYINPPHIRKNGRTAPAAQITITHSTKQLAYLEYKAELIRRMFGGECKIRTRSSQGKYSLSTATRTHKYFRILRKFMYPRGRKTITRQALDWLTPEGIALWYMDDGTARKNFNNKGWVSSVGTLIATYCSEEEAQVVVDYFREVHGIEFRKCKDFRRSPGQEWYLRTNTDGSKKFVALIAPYIIPEMLYKISHVPALDVHECQTPVRVCIECGAEFHEAPRLGGVCGKCYNRSRVMI